MIKIKNRRYWFVFIAVFVLATALMNQLLPEKYTSPLQSKMIIVAISIAISLMLSGKLMKW